eukprot:jgi/Mesvir1/27858/Mv07527-RA.1
MFTALACSAAVLIHVRKFAAGQRAFTPLVSQLMRRAAAGLSRSACVDSNAGRREDGSDGQSLKKPGNHVSVVDKRKREFESARDYRSEAGARSRGPWIEGWVPDETRSREGSASDAAKSIDSSLARVPSHLSLDRGRYRQADNSVMEREARLTDEPGRVRRAGAFNDDVPGQESPSDRSVRPFVPTSSDRIPGGTGAQKPRYLPQRQQQGQQQGQPRQRGQQAQQHPHQHHQHQHQHQHQQHQHQQQQGQGQSSRSLPAHAPHGQRQNYHQQQQQQQQARPHIAGYGSAPHDGRYHRVGPDTNRDHQGHGQGTARPTHAASQTGQVPHVRFSQGPSRQHQQHQQQQQQHQQHRQRPQGYSRGSGDQPGHVRHEHRYSYQQSHTQQGYAHYPRPHASSHPQQQQYQNQQYQHQQRQQQRAGTAPSHTVHGGVYSWSAIRMRETAFLYDAPHRGWWPKWGEEGGGSEHTGASGCAVPGTPHYATAPLPRMWRQVIRLRECARIPSQPSGGGGHALLAANAPLLAAPLPGAPPPDVPAPGVGQEGDSLLRDSGVVLSGTQMNASADVGGTSSMRAEGPHHHGPCGGSAGVAPLNTQNTRGSAPSGAPAGAGTPGTRDKVGADDGRQQDKVGAEDTEDAEVEFLRLLLPGTSFAPPGGHAVSSVAPSLSGVRAANHLSAPVLDQRPQLVLDQAWQQERLVPPVNIAGGMLEVGGRVPEAAACMVASEPAAATAAASATGNLMGGTKGRVSPLRVMSFNLLAQHLLEDHRAELYRHTPDHATSPGVRFQRQVAEILAHAPAVACLQEVDDFGALYAALRGKGYDGLYQKRTGVRRDGCATFWLTSRLRLVTYEGIEFARHGFNDNVALITALEILGGEEGGGRVLRAQLGSAPPGAVSSLAGAPTLGNGAPFFQGVYASTPGGVDPPLQAASASQAGPDSLSSGASPPGPVVLVANTHTLFNPKRGDLKLGQLRTLTRRLQQMAGEMAKGGWEASAGVGELPVGRQQVAGERGWGGVSPIPRRSKPARPTRRVKSEEGRSRVISRKGAGSSMRSPPPPPSSSAAT